MYRLPWVDWGTREAIEYLCVDLGQEKETSQIF